MPLSRPASDDVFRLGGAYGLAFAADEALRGASGAGLIEAPPQWPDVHVVRSTGASVEASESSPAIDVRPDSAAIRLIDGGVVTLDRAARTAVFRTPHPLSDDQLIHPALVYPASVFGHWLGRLAFHAGMFEAGGDAWALLGNRGAGKSSTLGWLAAAGYRVVADDMVVVDGSIAFAGPRSLDLQPDTAATLGLDGDAPLVRVGQRRRVALGPVEPERPIRGWVTLAWGEDIQVTRVPAADRLPLLTGHAHRPAASIDLTAILDLATLPTLELRRPKRLDALPAACEALVEAVNRLSEGR
jgi:hypothetical protein